MTGSQAKAAANLLTWYEAMGADEAIGESTVDRFAAPSPAPTKAASQQQAPAARPRPAPAASGTASAAPESIESVTTLEELEALVGQFEGCALKRTAKNTCFYRGSTEARIMLIGEAPGRDEDLQGKPFVGRAGKLLDLMLGSIGLDETSVYITNTIYGVRPATAHPRPWRSSLARRSCRGRSNCSRRTSWCCSAARPRSPSST